MASREKIFVENGVHCCCDTFLRRYPDEIGRLAARQSGSNIGASETPRLRLFEKGRLWLEDGGVAAKRHDDYCFYYHSWRNNVVIAFGTLSFFLT